MSDLVHDKSQDKTNPPDRTRYDQAVEMYKLDHTRWKDWALFYFGGIIATFAGWSQAKDHIGFWVPCVLAAGISILWILSGISIRMSSHAWRAVLTSMEDEKDGELLSAFPVFKTYAEKRNSTPGVIEEFCESLKIFKRTTHQSVTRLLILLGLLLFLFFSLATVLSVLPSSSQSPGGGTTINLNPPASSPTTINVK